MNILLCGLQVIICDKTSLFLYLTGVRNQLTRCLWCNLHVRISNADQTYYLFIGIYIFSLVKFLTPASSLQGYWDPYPIDMEFRPPCMVLSTIGISKPGKLEGKSTRQCETHLHQLHVCLPSSRQKTRLLYRMSLDFAPLLKHIPFMHYLWRHFAEQVTKYSFLFIIMLMPGAE